MGPAGTHEHTRGRRVATGWIGAAVIAAIGLAVTVVSVRDNKPAAAAGRAEASIEAPATIPAPTTTVPRPTTTTLPPGQTLPPGETVPAPDTLPPGPAERPTGLVAGIFYDTLTGVGVQPGVARCAADNLLATTSEPDLIAKGIAATPRPAEVNTLLDTAAKQCGVTQAQLDAAAAAGG